MNKKNSLSNAGKRFAYLWLMVVLALSCTLGFILPKSQLNNSIMALLPKADLVGVPTELLDEFNQKMDRQLIWLVSAKNAEQTEAAAALWVNELQKLPQLHNVTGKIDEKTQADWGRYLDQHRAVLLDTQTKKQLENHTQIPWVLGQLYSPFAGVSAAEISRDPLLLTRSLALAQQKNSGALQMRHNWLYGTDTQNKEWIFIRAELKASSYDVRSARQTVQALDSAQSILKNQYPEAQILQRGTLFYSHYASEQAEKDISTIGVLSAVGILLLIWIIFRSFRPLWLTLLSLSIGLLCGTTAVLLIYGQIHIITLVMSTSIIGVSIDYALLFLTERMVNGQQDSANTTLHKLLPPLLGAFISTAIAYLVLVLAPFSGLQQFSVFAVSGLLGAFLTVVCWFPFLTQKPSVRISAINNNRFISHWLFLFQDKPVFRYGLPLTVLLLTIIGVSKLTVDDDIGKLQALPTHLQQQENKIAQITGHTSDQKWLVVAAHSAEDTLQQLEALSSVLSEAQDQSILEGFRALPLPSIATQKQNIQLVNGQMVLASKALKDEGLTIQPQAINQQLITPKDWLDSPVSDGWRLLWSNLPNGESAVLVPLSGIKDEATLKQMTQKIAGVHWVDRKTEISALFASYRYYMSWLLFAAVLMISCLFVWRLKWKNGAHCIVPMLLSLGAALASLGWLGVPLNLFSAMALILVLGIGIDYTLFFSNPKGTSAVAMLTVLAAAFISELTFGLLAFSQTQAISGFGIVLSVGIFVALLLSPLAIPTTLSSKDAVHAHKNNND